MGYLRNIKKLYIMSFFHSLIPAYVIERLFWQQRGMNVQMVIYAEIIYALTVTLLRATVESFSSLGLRVISVGVGLLFGYVSMSFSIFAGFLGLSAVCLLYFGFYMVFARGR